MVPEIYEMRSARSGQFTTFDPDKKTKTKLIAPGEKVTVAHSDSPGIISRLWLTFPGWFWRHWDTDATNDTAVLKKLILRIYWDGNVFPSVECPMGDFFGNGHCEYRHFVSKYLGMSSGGFYCYLPMPFNQMRIEVENLHERIPIEVFFNANYEAHDKLPDGAGRLHALFRTGRLQADEPLPMLETVGKGHFVGCSLSMQGETSNYLGFLEAPEYVYVDSESDDTPTIVGTGLEDYFNGGWYFREGEYASDLHGVPLKDALRSMISMYRFHERDAIAFEKSLRFKFINPWHPEHLKPYWYASTAFWYQDRAVELPGKLQADRLMGMYRRRDTDHLSYP